MVEGWLRVEAQVKAFGLHAPLAGSQNKKDEGRAGSAREALEHLLVVHVAYARKAFWLTTIRLAAVAQLGSRLLFWAWAILVHSRHVADLQETSLLLEKLHRKGQETTTSWPCSLSLATR